MLKRTVIFVMACCFAAPLMTSCGDDGDSKKPEVKCPETCTNGCEEDGVTCKSDSVCPETCANGCKEDGVTCKEDAVCPETCKNGCKEDGVTCKDDTKVCPETCKNGCKEDGVTCKEDAVCPDTCANGCKEDGVTCKDDEDTCPDDCPIGCEDDGVTCKEVVCPDECPDACDDEGYCLEAKCPAECPAGQHCDESTGNVCMNVDRFICPVQCSDGGYCDETTNGTCMTKNVEVVCPVCAEGSFCDETTDGKCVQAHGSVVCPGCSDGSHCDDTTNGVCVMDGEEGGTTCPVCSEGSSCSEDTNWVCVKDGEEGGVGCPVCAEGSHCDDTTSGACVADKGEVVCASCAEGSRCNEETGACVLDAGGTGCPVCAEGTRCDETTNGACVKDVVGVGCPKCADGSHCDETTVGLCVLDDASEKQGCPVCEAGSHCDDTTDGLCQNDEYVAPVVHECETGEVRCKDNTLQKCSPEFVFVDDTQCDAETEACFSNEEGEVGCHLAECRMGTAKCENGAVLSCNDFYKYAVEQNCVELEETPVCEASGETASCISKCEAGATKCLDGKVMICGDDGLFAEKETCDAATHDCRQAEGQAAACVQHECSVGESKCDGSRLVVCDAGWWKVGSDCSDSGLLCTQTDKTASCIEKKCDEGWKMCDGQYLNTCTNNEYVVKFCKSMGGDYQCIDAKDGKAECKEILPILAAAADTDNDTIADWIECNLDEPEDDDNPIDYAECDKIDTDKDGTPDYKDDDSDGDTIPDKIEANNDGGKYEPDDADYDGIPNYRDTDSDGNGIPDKTEYQNGRDLDADGIPDYLDYDNDGDGFSDKQEIEGIIVDNPKPPAGKFSGYCRGQNTIGTAAKPVDCDGDGTPDYNDTDSDNDGLSDKVEGMVRLSSNGFLARYNPDTDGDGIDDKTECGKTGIKSLAECMDSDCYNTKNASGCYVYGYNAASCDGIPDLLEKDSDGDGLADDFEEGKVISGWKSNRLKADSDGDCVTDMIEYGAGTSPNNASDNPQSKGNFVFVVPYKEKSSPSSQALSFGTAVQKVDVYFSIDQSGSMNDEIKTLKTKIPSMVKTLTCTDLNRTCTENSNCADLNGGKSICSEAGRCIVDPAVGSDGKGCYADLWSGVGWWGDINKFRNGCSLQGNPNTTSTALGSKPSLGSSENCVQPPACAIGGATYCSNSSSYPLQCTTDTTKLGCVGYRKDAIKLYIQAGDEKNVDKTGFKISDAAKVGKILKDNKVRYIGLWGSTAARDGGIKQVACEAGSCPAGGNCASDCQSITSTELSKLYLAQINNSDIEANTLRMVRELTGSMNLVITSTAESIDARAAELIKSLEVDVTGNKTVQNRYCQPITSSSVNRSSKFQGINSLKPGTVVCYNVIPVDNQSIFPAKDVPQVLKARVKVSGDGSVLNSGVAYFLVPPIIEDNKGEAGN